MPISERNGVKIWRVRDRKAQFLRWAAWMVGVMAFILAAKTISDKTEWFYVYTASDAANDILSRAFPPKWSYINQLWRPIWDTFNIATLGTIFALLIAAPVAFLAARNTTPRLPIPAGMARLIPGPLRNVLLVVTGDDMYTLSIVRPFALLLIVASRSVNSLIWALLLVSIVGPGVLAGVVALSIRSIGFCAKLLYEAIEEISPVQVEAITATGARPLQVMVFGIVPQILPSFAGIAVFRWDINIRESTVLGLVGAGGIGLQLNASLNILSWTQVSVILVVILIAVVLGEWISAKVRGAII